MSFRNLVLSAGIFNMVAASPLAFPFSYRGYLGLLNTLNKMLGLGGRPLALPRGAFGMLAVNTAGLALALVGGMLLYAAANLEERDGIPLLNGIARLIFAVLVAYYVVTTDLAHIVLVIALIDVAIAVMFFYYILNRRHYK